METIKALLSLVAFVALVYFYARLIGLLSQLVKLQREATEHLLFIRHHSRKSQPDFEPTER